jgi:hypothetical protein
MKRYTEGPWTVVPTPQGSFGRDWKEIHGSGRHDYVVSSAYYDSSRDGTVCGVKISEEDARLIATAPELLEALQGLVGLVELISASGTASQLETNHRYLTAIEAIAKATWSAK